MKRQAWTRCWFGWSEPRQLHRDTGFAPYQEMRRWRWRFWWMAATAALLAFLLLRSCR